MTDTDMLYMASLEKRNEELEAKVARSQICNALKNSILTAGGFHWERCE